MCFTAAAHATSNSAWDWSTPFEVRRAKMLGSLISIRLNRRDG
jgi:hypothetical protein